MKFFLLFIVVLFLWGLNASNIYACTCELPQKNLSLEQQVKTAYKNSSAVFIGKVLEINQDKESLFAKVKFKVKKAWNKNLAKEIFIETGFGSGDCGFEFEIGETYLVYAYGEENNLQTNICTRTDEIKSLKEDIPVLDEKKKKKN